MSLDNLGLAALKLSGVQLLREHWELVGCWNRYILGRESKVKELRGNYLYI